MISILNRRELYTGTDAEDAARVWSTLKAEGIAYKMQTKGVRSSLAQGRRAGMGMTGGAARRAARTMPTPRTTSTPST